MKVVSGEVGIKQFIVGSGGVTNGDMVVISSGTVVAAAAAASDATVVGIALATADAEDVISVDLIGQGTLVQAPYTGSTKTTMADTDIGTAFDLSDETTVNLDDTTGGFCVAQAYDNDVDEIFFVVPAAKLYL